MHLRKEPGSAWVQPGGVEGRACEGPEQSTEPPMSSPSFPLHLGPPRTSVTLPPALSCFPDERKCPEPSGLDCSFHMSHQLLREGLDGVPNSPARLVHAWANRGHSGALVPTAVQQGW